MLLVKVAQFRRDWSKMARAKLTVVLSTNGADREWWLLVIRKRC